MTRYPKPSAEDIAIANAIIARVIVGTKRLTNFAPGDFDTAVHLSRKYTGYSPSSTCNACKVALHDKLRDMVGMSYARDPLDNDRIATRIEICVNCPAFHPSTRSCGRLVLDAVSSQPVNINGENIYPCGCLIDLKARFKSEQCPGKFWPR